MKCSIWLVLCYYFVNLDMLRWILCMCYLVGLRSMYSLNSWRLVILFINLCVYDCCWMWGFSRLLLIVDLWSAVWVLLSGY